MSGIMLKRLYLHNFKSFWKSEFEFKKLNCLIAPNNTGKSNLVEALNFLDNLLYQNSVVALSKVGIGKIRNYHYAESVIRIEADFVIKNRVLVGSKLIDYESVLYFRYWLDFDTKIANIDITIDGKIKSMDIDRADLKQGMLSRIIGDFESYIERYSDFYEKELDKKRFASFKFSYNSNTLRYGLETRYAKTKESVKSLFGLNIEKENEALQKPMNLTFIFNKNYLFSSYYFKADSMKKAEMTGESFLMENGKNLPEFLERLDKDIFDDISTSLIGEVELVQGIRIEKGVVPQLVFEEVLEKKVHYVGLQDISDGTAHFIAIMSAILGNKQAVGIMIEEPERHMHMRVLSYILDIMREDEKQIFFTTHSMEIVRQLELCEIIFMYRDFNGNTQAKRAEDIYNIKRLMTIYKNDMVAMIQRGVMDDMDLEEDS